jgi:hypothetical protein
MGGLMGMTLDVKNRQADREVIRKREGVLQKKHP